MAKTQNLSLNPTKISGTCGRLMCCLKYEQDAYEDLLRTSPKAESFVDTPDGRGTVTEVDLLRQRVKVRMEHQPELISVYNNTDIAVLRNGKAKKTDPPIPEDLAPISGGKKHGRKAVEGAQEGRLFLDPIKFRYSEEAIAEEQEISEAPEQAPEQTERSGRSNHRRRRPKAKPAQEQPEKKPAPQSGKQEKKEKTEQKEQPKAAEPAGDKEKPKRHRRPPRRRKPRPAGEGNQNG